MAKKGIKGFSGLRFWPVTVDTDTVYTTGVMTPIPYAVSGTVDRQVNENPLYADDDLYDGLSEFQRENIGVTVRELPLELEAALDGATYDSTKEEYTWGPEAQAPQLAMGFKALKRDGTYRMVKYYSCTVTGIKVDYQTAGGNNNEGSNFIISFVAVVRKADRKLIIKKDSADSNTVWLDTIDNIPV